MASQMKFCANLSFMFNEVPFLLRYEAARAAGFKAVESGFPFGFSVDMVESAKLKSGLEQILINIYTGDVTKGELGCAAIPGKEKEFAESFEKTLQYAKALNCSKIHLMSGKVSDNENVNKCEKECDQVYKSNIRYAASRLEKENLIGLIEPINPITIPGYYMNNYQLALDVVRSINSKHIRIMLDIFHLQQIQGSITSSLFTLLPYTGHIQIAQVPNRHEPNSPGELDYSYILKQLNILNYNDWIGLEYKPADHTEKGLDWMNQFGYLL